MYSLSILKSTRLDPVFVKVLESRLPIYVCMCICYFSAYMCMCMYSPVPPGRVYTQKTAKSCPCIPLSVCLLSLCSRAPVHKDKGSVFCVYTASWGTISLSENTKKLTRIIQDLFYAISVVKNEHKHL